jgi:hypothetical protein
LLSVGCAAYISVAAFNYLLLYPAINEIQNQMPFQVDKLSFLPGSGSNQSVLTAQITVSNPSDYSGFRLYAVSVTLFFYDLANRNNTLFGSPNPINGEQMIGAPLGPHSVDSESLVIGLTSQQATQLVSFQSRYPGQVMAEIMLRIDINTFLESVTGSSSFTRTQDISLS